MIPISKQQISLDFPHPTTWPDDPPTFSIDPVQQQYLARRNGDFPAYQLR